MRVEQFVVAIRTPGRGYHLVTREIEVRLEVLGTFRMGIAQLFLQHTSASLTLNENADPSVREDFKAFEEAMVPRDFGFRHDYEGSDDMPAHLKSSIFGCSLTIPISDGRFNLGSWQGVYLCEHRDRGSLRRIVVTLIGD